MIPISDSVRSRTFPVVNVTIIAITVVVFFFELFLGTRLDEFVTSWGVVPTHITQAFGRGGSDGVSSLVTLITAQFLHAGWLHLLGNMLFLWIFGDNVEDRLGHLRYLAFYLVCGVVANLAQVYAMPQSEIPLVGASGAIAGVLGAYVFLYPRAWVTVLVPVFFFLLPLQVPVILMLGFWFVSQLASGLAAITEVSQATGGTAWWAHIGGFVFGMLLIVVIPKPRLSRPSVRSSRSPSAETQLSGALGLLIRTVTWGGDIVRVLILIRIIFHLFALGVEGPLGFIVITIYAWTTPLVRPFAHLLPALRLDGFTIELYSILALIAYHVIVTIAIWGLSHLFGKGVRPQVRT